MKKKRPTPVKLPSGSWRCQVTIDGKRVSFTDPDPNIAQAKAMAAQAGIMEKEKKEKIAMTLEQAIDKYIEIKSNTLSPSTLNEYKNMKRIRFKELMQKRIDTITKNDMQKAINAEAKKVSPKTVENAYALVRPVLKSFGIDVSGAKLPQKVKKPISYLQLNEIEKLIKAADGDLCEIEILLAVWLGMRRSEILGLCWDCIDFDRKVIYIRRKLVYGTDKKTTLVDGAKTDTSQRVIPCPDYIMDKLKERKETANDLGGRIFTVYPNTVTRHVHRVCNAAGITDTATHGLRHTNAAVMSYLNVNDSHAVKRGGWSNEKTYKETYSYIFKEAATRDDKKIDRFFNKKAKNAHKIAHETKK